MNKTQDKLITSRILKNTFFNSITRFISGVSGFILTPFILNFLGLDLFGVWSFLFVLIAYLNLLDLGFAEAIVKFTAQYKAEKNLKAVFNLFTLSLVFYALLTIILVSTNSLIASFIGKVLPVPQNLPLTINSLLFAAIAFTILTKFSNVIVSIYLGLQKMELVSLNQFVYNTLLVLLILGSIYTGQPAFIIFWAPAIAQGLTFLSQLFLLKIILPQFSFSFSLINRSFLKKTLSLGTGIQVGISANILTTQIAKSLISTLGFNYLGIYELAFKVVAFLKSLPAIFLESLFPAIAELDILDKEKRNRLISQGTKYLGFFTYPLFFLSFAFMPQLLKLWLGKEIPLVAFAARIFLIGFLPDTIIGVISTAITGIGKIFIHVEYATLILILNTVGMYFLLKTGDFKVLLYVFPVAVFIGFFWKVLRFSKKVLKLTLNFHWKNFVHSGVDAFVAVFFSFQVFEKASMLLNSFFSLAAAGIVFILIYLPTLLITRFFTIEDWRLIKKLFSLKSFKIPNSKS